MKKLLFILLLTIPFFCFSQDYVLSKDLRERNDVVYYNGEKFTGFKYSYQENGLLQMVCQYKNGLVDGHYTWFYEDGNELFVVTTKLHPYVKGSNFKLIYPVITVVNLDNLNVTKAFPNTDNIKADIDTQPFKTYNEFADKNISMIGADMSVNFVKIGVPQITFNKGTSTYATRLKAQPISRVWTPSWRHFAQTTHNQRITDAQLMHN